MCACSFLYRDLTGSRILDFEIRESDRVVFEKLESFSAVVQQSTCVETSASKLSIDGGIEICVISGKNSTVVSPLGFASLA